MVGTDGKRQAATGLVWKLVKIERDYQWYREGSAWRYEPVNRTQQVATGRVDVSATMAVAFRAGDLGPLSAGNRDRAGGWTGQQRGVQGRLVRDGVLDRHRMRWKWRWTRRATRWANPPS